MTNVEIIRRFESGNPPADSFHHADHVRLAFAYLCEYPALQALEKFCSALKSFALARSNPQLYHETITFAFFFLIHERMARCEKKDSQKKDWEAFIRANPDLLVWKNGVLSRYYNNSTLESDLARRVFVLPDISNHV